ncbi:MAG: heme o synthase [Gammaproteobacteria bacterium]|nr:heme o synthase [Gammaproteobacteria bacterium]MDE1984749.1 heme o synthase [Gammaproteobacteria bacterium]MDE2461069.1 heme o synthase [Gammaproteobacteria bacterium]
MNTHASEVSHVEQSHARWRDYYELGKPRIVMLIVFTAMVGMFLAVPGAVPLQQFIAGTIGIGLAASCAAAINQLLDRRADAVMFRTRRRPLPQQHVTERQVVIYALILCVLSMAILLIFVNWLTALLTFVSMIGYAIIYTGFLKRASPQNIVIGGLAGAAPPVCGWAAVTGQVSAGALLLCLIIFLWTPPHFWALAIHRREDYAKANVPMLPVTHGVPYTVFQIILYTVLLVMATVLPFLIGMSGLVYLVGALLLGGIFLVYAIGLHFSRNPGLPMRSFAYSIVYLTVLFILLLVDHYLPFGHFAA